MITLRPLRPTDRNYVIKCWLEAAKEYTWAKRLGPTYWGHRKLVERLLDNCVTTIAALEEDDDSIVGFACTGPGLIVHFVYVRDIWQRRGVAHLLLEPFLSKDVRVTHPLLDRARNLPSRWHFDPYALLECS